MSAMDWKHVCRESPQTSQSPPAVKTSHASIWDRGASAATPVARGDPADKVLPADAARLLRVCLRGEVVYGRCFRTKTRESGL